MVDFMVEMQELMSFPNSDPKIAKRAKTVKKIIEVAIEIDDMLTQIRELIGDTECFALGYVYNFAKRPTGAGFDKVDQDELAAVFPQQPGVQDLFQDVVTSLQKQCTPPPGGRTRRDLVDKARKMKERLMKSKYFRIPLLEKPALALGLLSGKTLDLVEFTSPKVEFGVDFTM